MYQRGTTPEGSATLWRDAMGLVDPKRYEWKRLEAPLKQIWQGTHDDLVRLLRGKFEAYRDAWLTSAAGKHFAHLITESQYSCSQLI
jgi:hypothetical protein